VALIQQMLAHIDRIAVDGDLWDAHPGQVPVPPHPQDALLGFILVQ